MPPFCALDAGLVVKHWDWVYFSHVQEEADVAYKEKVEKNQLAAEKRTAQKRKKR